MNDDPPAADRFPRLRRWAPTVALIVAITAAVIVPFVLSSLYSPTEKIIVGVLLILLFGNRLPPGARGGMHDRIDRR